jgi:hypothetical protein
MSTSADDDQEKARRAHHQEDEKAGTLRDQFLADNGELQGAGRGVANLASVSRSA